MNAFAPKPSRTTYPIGSDRIWFDPQLITRATYSEWRNVILGVNTIDVIAVPNPRRWGIGFFKPSPANVIEFAPWPELDVAIIPWNAANIPIAWFSLAEYGPLVCSGWWGRSTFGQTIRVAELIRN